MSEKKGLVLDFDGTLDPKSYGSLYKVVDTKALPDAAKPEYETLRDKYLPRVYDGTLQPTDELYWLRETLDIYIRHGLTRDRWMKALHSVELRPGARDLLAFARSKRIPMAIVSYGVADFIEWVLVSNGIDLVWFEEIFAARLQHAGGLVVGYEDSTFVYPDNKDEWSKRFADRQGIRTENLLAIGDSGADRKLGGLKGHRLGIAKDQKNADQMAPYFSEVVVTDSLDPAKAWLAQKLA